MFFLFIIRDVHSADRLRHIQRLFATWRRTTWVTRFALIVASETMLLERSS